MKPAPFTYHRARTTREAVSLLGELGDDGRVLAGGQSLVPLMNFRLAEPEHLVDINPIAELDYVRRDNGDSVQYHGTKGGLPAAGPGGSRLTVMYAGAIKGAAGKIKDKARRIAAHQLEASPDDLEWVDGGFQIRGNPTVRREFADLAMAAYLFATELPEGLQSGLEASHVCDHPYTTMPAKDRSDLGVFYPCMGHACHVAMVEVDRETGHVEILRYAAVHDAGTMVNPRSLEGQILGGTAQGVATALLEEVIYDDQGQPLTAAFTDFLMPTAMEVPELLIGHEETPSPLTEYGIKGGGEAGRMMAPGAISAAIDDALTEFGVRVTELPATPERIVGWIADPPAS